jgi:hypothetical protein
VILYWNYFGLPGVDCCCCRGGREFLLHLLARFAIYGWELYMSLVDGKLLFFSLFLWWNFWDLLLFQRLNHFATIRAWKSTSRLVYLERSGRPPFSTYTRAQAGRRVYQPSVFVTTNVFVCELHNNSIRRRNDETPSALISILFLLFICPPLIERVESIVFTLLIYLPTFWV